MNQKLASPQTEPSDETMCPCHPFVSGILEERHLSDGCNTQMLHTRCHGTLAKRMVHACGASVGLRWLRPIRHQDGHRWRKNLRFLAALANGPLYVLPELFSSGGWYNIRRSAWIDGRPPVGIVFVTGIEARVRISIIYGRKMHRSTARLVLL